MITWLELIAEAKRQGMKPQEVRSLINKLKGAETNC